MKILSEQKVQDIYTNLNTLSEQLKKHKRFYLENTAWSFVYLKFHLFHKDCVNYEMLWVAIDELLELKDFIEQETDYLCTQSFLSLIVLMQRYATELWNENTKKEMIK